MKALEAFLFRMSAKNVLRTQTSIFNKKWVSFPNNPLVQFSLKEYYVTSIHSINSYYDPASVIENSFDNSLCVTSLDSLTFPSSTLKLFLLLFSSCALFFNNIKH